MAKATSKQIAYAEKLNEKLPEDQRTDSFEMLMAFNDKHQGTVKASAIIEQLKAKLGTSDAQVTCYTQAEDAPHARRETRQPEWFYTRNGPGRDEADNQ